MDYVHHITDLIGNTPLVKLNKIVKNCEETNSPFTFIWMLY